MTGQIEHSIPCRKKPISAFPACRSRQAGAVDEVFHKVASRYDLMNDLMSAGLHRVWKDISQRVSSPRGKPGFVISMSPGHGRHRLRIAKAGSRRTEITVLDINARHAGGPDASAPPRRRFEAKLDFVEANAESCLRDNSFDAYTIAFGIRNVPRIDQALARPAGS